MTNQEAEAFLALADIKTQTILEELVFRIKGAGTREDDLNLIMDKFNSFNICEFEYYAIKIEKRGVSNDDI